MLRQKKMFEPNELYFKMCKLYKERVSKESKLIIVNAGSSRSSKTWDSFHLIVTLCRIHKKKSLDIYILRDTLVNCRDFTMKEFQDCLKVIGIYNPNDMIQSPKPVYKLFGHKIKFRGLDDEQATEGYPSDILFFNEVLETNKGSRDGLIMRCRKLVLMDFNPKFSDHEVYTLEKRSDCVFLHSTYLNNRHLQPSVKKEIESYNPDIPENVTNGTADKYRWKVYGLGERCNREGLVFPEVTWVDAIPADCDQISYGMDFGMTAQTAIVKCAIRLRKPKCDLFIQKLFYAPTESSDIVNQVLTQLQIGIGKTHVNCDNNLPGWIADLQAKGKYVLPTKKFPGSREYWITSIKKFNIHLVKDIDLRKEQENFCYRVVDGKQLSETIKKYDHILSATGYSVVSDFKHIIDK